LNEHAVCRNNILAQHHIPNFYIIFVKKKNKKNEQEKIPQILRKNSESGKIGKQNSQQKLNIQQRMYKRKRQWTISQKIQKSLSFISQYSEKVDPQ
jgi:hypothetical protein